MTDKFYLRLLEYINQKEKQSLIRIFQKKRVRIDGFRMNTDIPPKLLATYLAKNEKYFFKILQEFYTPSYADKDAAVNAFTSDTAILCFTYFVNNEDLDETFLTSLMGSQSIIPNENIPLSLDKKAQKKSDEFRQKYLSDHKELLKVKQELESALQHVRTLQKALEEKDKELNIVQDKVQYIQNDHQNTCKALNGRINELEGVIHLQEQLANSLKNRMLVLLKDEAENCKGINTLAYGQIAKLITIVNDYSEILFVANDIPFSAKRQINKIDGILEKLHSFSTMGELREYIEKRRHQ